MNKLILTAVVAASAILVLEASADGGKKWPGPPSFVEIDSNADQLISREEMLAAMQARLEERGQRRGPAGDPEERFSRVDEDGDGYLNEAEFDAARAKMEERRGHRRRRGDCDDKDSES
ncbi:MAG: hypothetical protein K0U72_03720 [Gammaproteobacteria bacterium]|nr:hypothetical protein [Gammaproteobacteria bacterium]